MKTREFSLGMVMCLYISWCPAQDAYDGYYNYLGDWPKHVNTVYSEDIQGIAHSRDAWFITKEGSGGTALYKIPVTSDLANPIIAGTATPTSSGLTARGFHEFKGMDSYRVPQTEAWIIFVGLQGGNEEAGLAFFDDDLVLLGWARLNQISAGWCAVDNNGNIFSGENKTGYAYRYSAPDWAAIDGQVSLDSRRRVDLIYADGSPFIVNHFQGGDFTPEGNKLYIVTGIDNESPGPHGIHVFDATESSTQFRRIQRSYNPAIFPNSPILQDADVLFQYEFDPGGVFLDWEYQEPEGLTFWDLTGLEAPNVRGELHVLLLDNDRSADEIWLKHYTKGIYVDRTFGGPSNGDPSSPDKTVGAGVNRALEDMEVRIAEGSYPESLTITKRVKLVKAWGSSVVIGLPP